MIIISILVFVVILSVLVLIHEFGHFIMAKRSGIGVEEFGFGLPPRAFGKKIGETIYSINWLPFGGFVRLVGEDPTDKNKDAKNSFFTKKPLTKAKVVVAGVVMNLLLGVAIYYGLLMYAGFQFVQTIPVPYNWVGAHQEVLVTYVEPNSPAQKAGIKAGEYIIGINGQGIETAGQMQKIVRPVHDSPITVKVENDNHSGAKNLTLTPTFDSKKQVSMIGVGIADTINYVTPAEKAFSGFIQSYNIVAVSLGTIVSMVGQGFQTGNFNNLAQNVSGPIGIAAYTNYALIEGGIVSAINLAALLSLNLAVLNILPVPALDGGRFFFILIEAITRKRVHPTFEKWVHTIGFAVLIGLIILISANDIAKLINKQFPF